MKNKLSLLFAIVLSTQALAQTITPAPFGTLEYVDINDIKAATMVHGDMWWRPGLDSAGCEYPKGSGKHAQFVGSLWIGGYDAQHKLHVSAQTYRQKGNDFWPGPLDNTTDSATYSSSQDWAKIWKVNKTTIDSFRVLSTHTLANTPAVILQWPAKGNANARGNNNATLQVTEDMAPFKDVDNNGIYNALAGDYPDIKGDQLLWWVINDNGANHGETGDGKSLKLQIHISAYAYKTANLQSTIYYEYLIKNKSAQNYDSTVVGLFSAADLGFPFDDFLGFDSTHRMSVLYNGTNIDGYGQYNAYGTKIPMSAVSFLELPGDNGSVRQPAGGFMYLWYNNSAQGYPQNAAEYYNYLNARFRDGSQIMNSQNVSTKYAFTGDPGSATAWTECGLTHTPGDRTFVQSSNAFSLPAGETKKIAMALIITQPDTANACPNGSFSKIKDLADTVWHYYGDPSSVPTAIKSVAGTVSKLNLYPNPAETVLNIALPTAATGSETVQVYDALGRSIALGMERKQNLIMLDVRNLPAGVYTVQCRNGEQLSAGLFVKQ